MRRAIGFSGLVVAAVCATAVRAEPPSGVTATVLARGTYDAFNVRSDPHNEFFDFRAKAKPEIDIVVRQHDYASISSTGWHSHPGPVFITVTIGTLTVYEYDDPNCTPRVLRAGDGYVDTGRGHIIRNESGQPATDVSVITAPVGGSFRTNLDAPGPYCPF